MSPTEKYKALAVALITTIIRYYNYALFGLSATILAEEFFPGDNSHQMLGFFIVFSVSALSRTFGAVIFGSISDKISRIHSIKITVLIGAISTIIIAFLPSFSYLGQWSIIILTASRILFLSSLAGEIDTIKIFTSEIIGRKHKHIIISLVTSASQVGVIFASALYYLALNYSDHQWLWRGNFFLGGVLSLGAFLIRGNMRESDEFLVSKSQNETELKKPLITLLFENKYKFLLATIINGFLGSGYHFLIIFLNSFLAYIAKIITLETASLNNIILISTYALMSPIAGYITEKSDNKKLTTYALLINIVLTILLLLTNLYHMLWIQVLIISIIPFYQIPSIIITQSLFPAVIRIRMCSLSHAIGSMLFSSTTPLICMLLWNYKLTINSVFYYFLFSMLCLLLNINCCKKILKS
ncbi:MAG TPA: MFS transporter [Candidatus Megaira endosymbiont of Nemacystus decipiens]|nr:MFS transporter [Candidatus Megaera endosymbiont of Nemacystus decipiens]